MKTNLKAIIYDFDGVICDSVNVKTNAFAELYQSYGEEIIQKVVDYHLENGGISRYKKIEYYHRELLGKTDTSQDEINELANRFADLVKDKVIKAPYIQNAFEFIKANAKTKLQFICTGTPETEILDILEQRNIIRYFDGVYGSPKTKTEIIKKILSANQLSPNDCIFLGDAISDYKAAKECNVPFVGLISDTTVFPIGTVVIENFSDEKCKAAGL